MTDKISVSRALGELKMLDNRIAKLTKEFVPVDIIVNDKLLKSGKTRDLFCMDVLADFRQLVDLKARRNLIKIGIVKSNAITTVNINNVEMTVAEAIEKKSSIQQDKDLLNVMRNVWEIARQVIVKNNESANQRLDKLLETTFSKDSTKVKSDEYESVAKPFMLRNESKMVDPIDLQKQIKLLDDAITKFESEVDICLSESNARTEIEI